MLQISDYLGNNAEKIADELGLTGMKRDTFIKFCLKKSVEIKDQSKSSFNEKITDPSEDFYGGVKESGALIEYNKIFLENCFKEEADTYVDIIDEEEFEYDSENVTYEFDISEEALTPLKAFYWANRDSLKSMHEQLRS